LDALKFLKEQKNRPPIFGIQCPKIKARISPKMIPGTTQIIFLPQHLLPNMPWKVMKLNAVDLPSKTNYMNDFLGGQTK